MALAVYLAGMMISGAISYHLLADNAVLVITGGMFIALYDLMGLWLQQRNEREKMAASQPAQVIAGPHL